MTSRSHAANRATGRHLVASLREALFQAADGGVDLHVAPTGRYLGEEVRVARARKAPLLAHRLAVASARHVVARRIPVLAVGAAHLLEGAHATLPPWVGPCRGPTKQIKRRAPRSWAYGASMSPIRRLAVLLFAASLSAGVLAQPTIPVDDETIFVAVEDALRSAPSLAGADIYVTTREGAVTLRGFASTMENIATAGRLAARVRGVSAVYNKIRVANRPSRA